MKDQSEIDIKRQRDFDDLQHEISGVDVGRMRRFLGPDDDRTPEGKRKKRALERVRQRLSDMMLDPNYARLHQQLGDRLSEAEREAESVLERLQSRLEQITEAISDMEDCAARGPDGRLVFRTAIGQAVYADGTMVPDEIVAGIMWPTNAPSAEEYFALQTQRGQVAEHLTEWDSYRHDVLGPIRDRLDDEENPFQSADDLQNALDQIENSMPKAMAAPTPETTETDNTPQATSSIKLPTIGSGT